MLFFAIFTVGYFAGVITVLLIFPPNTNELREQEDNSLEPILKDMEKVPASELKGEISSNAIVY